MINIYSFEKKIKKSLKNIIPINLNTVVKILIIGVNGIFFSCNDSGGTANRIDNTIPPPTNYSESYILENESTETWKYTFSDGSIINDLGDIVFYGRGAGLKVSNNSSYLNSSTITATSSNISYTKKVYGDGNLINIRTGTTGEFAAGISAENNSVITNGNSALKGNFSKIILTGEGAAMYARNSSTALNYGNIELFTKSFNYKDNILTYVYNPETDKFDTTSWATVYGNTWSTPIGMLAFDNSIAENYGTITITNGGVGMRAMNNSTIINESMINVGSQKEITPLFLGMHLINNSIGKNNKEIIVNGNGLKASGVFVESGSQFINNGLIDIDIENQGSNSNYGILVIGNQGNSIDYGFNIIGNSLSPTSGINNGRIIVNSAVGTGMYAIYSGASVTNNNEIFVKGADSIGMEARFGAIAKNNKNGKLIINSGKTGMLAFEAGARALNYGSINLSGPFSIGMEAQDGGYISNEVGGIINISYATAGMLAFEIGSIAVNKGTINANSFTYGMLALEGGTAINEVGGTINVAASARGGMYANGLGSKIINRGTINIKRNNNNNSYDDSLQKLGLYIENGATFENSGIINSLEEIDITSDSNSQYVIDIDKNGNVGTVSAPNLSLHGNIGISSSVIEKSYKDEYTLENVFIADTIDISNLEMVSSPSLLYSATLSKNSEGNLDANLERNEMKISDFVDNHIFSLATQLDSNFTSDEYATFNHDLQDIINNIFRNSNSKQSLSNTIESIIPSIYSNLGRQILETNKIFKKNNLNIIQNLNINTYTFSFLGEHQKISTRNFIESYDSNLTGFIGALKLNQNTHISLGYGYNNIDYSNNGNGNIKTLYLNLNKDFKSNDFIYNFNLNTNYNFHKNERVMKNYERVANSKFSSYSFGLSNSISKTFGDKLYFTPYGSLNLTYLSYNSFTETGANSLNTKIDSINYLSFLPTFGIKFEKIFNNLTTFLISEYSYELGTFDKTQRFIYNDLNISHSLYEDDLNSDSLSFEFGLIYKINNLFLTTSIGKTFENKDQEFAKVSIDYIF